MTHRLTQVFMDVSERIADEGVTIQPNLAVAACSAASPWPASDTASMGIDMGPDGPERADRARAWLEEQRWREHRSPTVGEGVSIHAKGDLAVMIAAHAATAVEVTVVGPCREEDGTVVDDTPLIMQR